MSEDDQLLLASFISYWLILALLIAKSKRKVLTASINLVIHLTYSSYFIYGLCSKSQSGASLAWLFFLLFTLWTHSAINLGQIIYLSFKKKK